ncbi:MAG TPA: chemotaxis protein [Betaproteobacteria bacterium]|nr:chemotaxis protein [Betaproteobacteria bacterium]
MKKNLPITNRENDYPAETHIVSTTDLKGMTDYVNEDFIRVSGFPAEELLHKNHNVVRHPDMPPAAFADLWNVIKQGKPWMGVVKNRCKNGDHYWVDAYVTPIYEGSRITGYQSVRVKPDRAHVARAESLYHALTHGIPGWKRLFHRAQPGLLAKIALGYVVALLPVLAVFYLGETPSPAIAGLAALAGVGGGFAVAALIARPWRQAAQSARKIFGNAVAQHVYTGRSDELGQLQLVIQALQSQAHTVVWRIDDATAQLDGIANRSAAVAEQTSQGIQQQREAISQVATTMDEMSATVQEVARNAANTATATAQANHAVNDGEATIDRTVDEINQLTEQVEQIARVIRTLVEDSEKIGSVVDIIRNIADRTNLLALNAAIEAARAGKHGRGFAVVADEVRTLANRTQTSTDEIQQMIEQLQGEVSNVMAEGQRMTQESAAQATQAGAALESITQAVTAIIEMSARITATTEEQGAVSGKINTHVAHINQVAEQTVQAPQEAAGASHALASEVAKLQCMMGQFGVK